MKHAAALLLVLVSMSAPAQDASLHRGVPLGVDAAQVEARYPLPAGDTPGAVILLQGAAAGGRFSPNSHTLPAPAAPVPARAPMPLHENLLGQASVRAYGLEERLRVEHGPAGLQLSCAAGTRPAGVLLQGPWYLPRAALRLQARFSGAGTFRIAVADAQDAARERSRELDDMRGELHAGAGEGTLAMALPAGLDRASWRQFVIHCPSDAATLKLDSLSLEPVPGAIPPRATWIWDSAEWLAGGAALLDWARSEGIGELFIVVPLKGDTVADPAALGGFIRRARAAGIAVSSVDGDPHMVLPAQHDATVRRARAYAAYNAAAAPEARLRAIGFDIEPYLLPAGTLPPADADRHYLSLARALRRAAGKTALEFVVPYWWSEKTALLESLARVADGLAVMDYRTAPGEIVRFGVPFLDWAARHGKRVHIALEAGPVAPETQRRYLRAATGEPGSLMLVQAGAQSMLVLLRAPATVPGAVMYRLEGERIFDGSATSFHRNEARLRALLPGLERDFSAWPGFAGVALHGWR